MNRKDFIKTLLIIPAIFKASHSLIKPRTITIPDEDRKFIECQSMTCEQICKIYRVPNSLLNVYQKATFYPSKFK